MSQKTLKFPEFCLKIQVFTRYFPRFSPGNGNNFPRGTGRPNFEIPRDSPGRDSPGTTPTLLFPIT